MLVGAVVALQLAFWQANLPPFLTFGRLRPLHTNAVIFAFVGNMMFAGIYYSTQRLVKARLRERPAGQDPLLGLAAHHRRRRHHAAPRLTQGKEYAELEWPIDIAIALIWVVFAINFFWTLAKRAEKHLYVAIWFYIATIITVAVLHIVNSLAVPVFAGLKSYSIYGGAQDALVQWWYGHNAVAFFLTTPILGIMYYFLPKAAERPGLLVPAERHPLLVAHLRLHLGGPAPPAQHGAARLGADARHGLQHHALGAELGRHAQRPAHAARARGTRSATDPVLKFFAAGVTFYGMATFEGPLLSIKSVNGLAHYTDWIIGHVHAGALGWNGFMAAGMFYWMVPRLYGTRAPFARSSPTRTSGSATFGILLYVVVDVGQRRSPRA